jgi:hypothetical protein
MNEEMKNDFDIADDKQKKMRKILISNIYSFCKNYPNENMCQCSFIKTYKEYPYRLHQNLPNVINMLDEKLDEK